MVAARVLLVAFTASTFALAAEPHVEASVATNLHRNSLLTDNFGLLAKAEKTINAVVNDEGHGHCFFGSHIASLLIRMQNTGLLHIEHNSIAYEAIVDKKKTIGAPRGEGILPMDAHGGAC